MTEETAPRPTIAELLSRELGREVTTSEIKMLARAMDMSRLTALKIRLVTNLLKKAIPRVERMEARANETLMQAAKALTKEMEQGPAHEARATFLMAELDWAKAEERRRLIRKTVTQAETVLAFRAILKKAVK